MSKLNLAFAALVAIGGPLSGVGLAQIGNGGAGPAAKPAPGPGPSVPPTPLPGGS